ncbi:MAG: TrkA family potassium uptake protein [Candidatus Methanomethyliaceae archaeon]|nr:TrkA family potassium uptake protein [Candidatus Methanomethyliaceae archaeon]
MKAIIAGVGRTGKILIRELKENGNDVAVIDIDADKCKEVSHEFDILVFKGDITDIDDLSKININEYEIFISVTGSDEKNILGCLLAKDLGIQKVIARVSDPRLSKIAGKLGINHTICPEEAAAEKILQITKESDTLTSEEKTPQALHSLGVRRVRVKVGKNAPVIGMQIGDLPLRNEWMIVRVKDENDRFIPVDASLKIQSDFVLDMLVKESALEAVKALFS